MLTFESMEKIAIASGKGGVGKTSITFMLASYLKNKGYKVGLLDADIYGPNLTELLPVTEDQIKVKHDPIDKKLVPIKSSGLLINSISYVLDQDKAAIWRGPVLSKAIKQLYLNTRWGNLDYLLIDMPPGTGDAYLTILNDLDIKKALLVAVDDTFCISDLKRTQSLMKKFNVESLGIVENMSENVDSSGNIEESVRIKDELKDNILFSLPRIKRNEFYQEVKQLDKLKKYFPNNLLQK
jgi:ATP-binding protein involved in chromosome partitioning|tara:strand:+ start:4655 stop:5371 length:717 start_codon:yes stop_codon:yes gene_type:complete